MCLQEEKVPALTPLDLRYLSVPSLHFRYVQLHEGLAVPLVQHLEMWQLFRVPVGRDCILPPGTFSSFHFTSEDQVRFRWFQVDVTLMEGFRLSALVFVSLTSCFQLMGLAVYNSIALDIHLPLYCYRWAHLDLKTPSCCWGFSSLRLAV